MSVLVVNDVKPSQQSIVKLLEMSGEFRVFEASDGVQALETLRTIEIDCVVYDWNLPSHGKTKLAEHIRTLDRVFSRYTYLVPHINPPDPTWIKQAFNANIDDYISNTATQEIVPRLKNIAHHCTRYKQLTQDNKKLKKILKQQQKFMCLDPSTSLPNLNATRNHFNASLTQCLNRGGSVSLLLMKINNFETIKSNLTQPVFKELMKNIANRYRKLVRPLDRIGRLKRDQFLWVCVSFDDQTKRGAGFERVLRGVGKKTYETRDGYMELAMAGVATTIELNKGPIINPKDDFFEEVVSYMQAQLKFAAVGEKVKLCKWPPEPPELLPIFMQ